MLCQGHSSVGTGKPRQPQILREALLEACHQPPALVHTRDPLSYPPQMARGAWQVLACNKEGAIDIVSNPKIQIFSFLADIESFLFSNQMDLFTIRENECI